ncbi:MAG: HAMP domain-containing histidine kinase [Gemmatimonadaceae bacterium]|nr:HAMP domain-containing histidine kinase [Gemmatimonadaceae bacterium]
MPQPSTTPSERHERGAHETSLRAAGRWARRGWTVTTALLVLLLMGNAFASFRGSHLAVPGLNRGQADLLGAGLWEMLATPSTVSDDVRLASFLRSHQRRGLRYIALVDGDGRVRASAGNALGDGPPPAHDPISDRIPLVPVGQRMRAYFPEPISPAPAPARPSYMVIEFEPVAAVRLVRNARRSFVLSVTGALVLAVAAWVFFRTSIRYDDARLQIEQQRHLTQLGEMSAVLAHEIRNPLASLKGHAQLAVERLADGSREKRCIEHVIADANRLEMLTTDLLSFARTAPLDVAPVSPVELVRMAGHDVLGDASLALEAEDAPASWPMDGARVRQALVNLLDNARQAAPGAPPVVRVAQQGSRLVIEVRDNGPGLPPGSEERIFDAFFTTRTNGTGLGLAVASRVAEQHGGAITARNDPAGGAVFRMIIPHPER